MTRIALTDDTGRWFDDDKATGFDENTRWDGSNHISRATDSQWDHEALYYTATGNWILHTWSQYQGTLETYETIDRDTAIQWLCSQECWDDKGIEKLPARVQEAVKEGILAAEL